jgi:hypothetical protein
MAYEIQLYCTTGGLTPGEGFDALLARASGESGELPVSDRSSGAGWVAAHLDPDGCLLQFSAGSPLVAAMVAEVAPDDPTGRVAAADAVVTLTLSGDVEWAAVSALWRAAKALWDAVAYDEGSGFGVDLTEEELRAAVRQA